MPNGTDAELTTEMEALKAELAEARETMRALREGEVDALVATFDDGEHILTVHGGEKVASCIFENAIEAIFVCDETGRIIRASQAAHSLCGLNPLLQRFETVLSLRFAPRATGLVDSECDNGTNAALFFSLDDVLKGKSFKGLEVQFDRRDGQRFDLHLSVGPLFGATHNLLGCISILTDITEQKRAEFALVKAKKDLEASNQAKIEFIATLAHELRNPLAPIRNAVELMRLIGNESPRLETARSIIARQVGVMARLLDDLLDVSRIESGKAELRKTTVNLVTAIQHAVDNWQHLMTARGHRLTVSLPSTELLLHADAARLEQIFGNLLNNAAKYTPKNGLIWIGAEQAGESIVARVKDNGIGISAEMLPHVFDMFMQADSSPERSHCGLGIGLTLVSQLVQMHGGTVTAVSAGLGMGSEFVVSLPVSQDAAFCAFTATTHEIQSHVSRRVLIIEDNPDSRDSLKLLLTSWGHDVEVAEDGYAGVEMAARLKPEIAIIDLSLPGLHGFEVARQIRAAMRNEIFLVALTGYGQSNDIKKALAAGFDKHLIKPADIRELEAIVSAPLVRST